MKIVLISIGKTKKRYLLEELEDYNSRINKYISFDFIQLSKIKNTRNISINELLLIEGNLLLDNIKVSDYVILLDDKGRSFTSMEFSKKVNSLMLSDRKRIVFLIGGAYGFSRDLYTRSNENISMSKMTFSHQMVRVFFMEQLYRSFTILNNEPYHNK